jgi:hypothetical protein
MSNRRDIQFHYSPHNKATVLDCSFIVDHANGNGFGVRSLKQSGRVSTVFMNTSATPGTTSNGQTNPNPAAGYIIVTLQDNYNTYLSGYSGFVSPPSGSAISTGLTTGQAYTIASLGSTTAAQWQTAGLAKQLTPTVNQSFIAKATSVAGGGTVYATTSSGIDHIEVVGDANQMNNTTQGTVQGSGVGMQLILACYKNGVLTAPADNTVIGLNFYLNNSAQGV